MKQGQDGGCEGPCVWGGSGGVGVVGPAWELMEWLSLDPLYTRGLAALVLFQQLRRLDMVSWLPGVVAFRVPFPFDKVLQLFSPSMTLVAPDGLDFVLFFVVDKVRWWSRVVLPVFFCFDEWG